MAQSKKIKHSKLSPLDRIGWMSECSDALRTWVSENGHWQDVPKGKILFHDGDSSDGMLGIGTGALDIEFTPDHLDEILTLRVQPGGWLGQAALLDQMPRPLRTSAAIESRIFFVPRRNLRELLRKKPEFWPEFYRQALRTNLEVMAFLCEVLSLSPEARVSQQLLRLSALDTDVSIRQNDLVAILGMSRSNLRRALSSLVKAGVISTGYNRVEILNRTELLAISKRSK